MAPTPFRISFEELQDNDDGLYLFNEIPYTENGVLRSEQQYINGLEWGAGTLWFASGKLHRTMSLYRGVYHGDVSDRNESGDLISLDVYEFGILLLGRRRNEAGEMAETFRLTRNDPGFATLATFRKMYPDEILDLREMPQDLKRW